jgi:uncharacterized protein (DUF2252 family)
MASVLDTIRSESPAQRQAFILDVFDSCFGDQIRASQEAWRIKFRKMAASPFAFYRGSAALYYADVSRDHDPFLNDKTSRVWIQGDLHAENFGTYKNSEGILVFDVNDYDEAYVGAFTWDLKRLVASLHLIGYEKALSDEDIRQMIATAARAYAEQVAAFAATPGRNDFALTMANTSGKLLEVLKQTRLMTRVGLLDDRTYIENYERHFIHSSTVLAVDEVTRNTVLAAFEQYVATIPQAKRFKGVSYRVKDVVARKGVGIGSAGLASYTLLLEGGTEALENDILLYMKQAQTAAPSRVVTDQRIKDYFLHDGHRTVISQLALQSHADPWIGYTTLNGVGQLVDEVSPYENDLEWDGINALDEILELVTYLGKATAKIHCVSDDDSDQTLVPFSTEQAIHGVIKGREDDFVQMMVRFGEEYGSIVRDDHRLFVDAFRNKRIPGL